MPAPDVIPGSGTVTREHHGKHSGARDGDDAAVGAGLDALDTPTAGEGITWRRFAAGVVPPLVALLVALVIWQALWAAAFWPEYKLPSPLSVWQEFVGVVVKGEIWGILWTSLHRAVLGFAVSVLIATPVGLLVAKVRVVRAAIGSLLAGLQSLPSVAWVPAAILWFGLTDSTIYFVVLMGAIPSIANGLVAGIDQIPPILPRVGHVMGANRVDSARLILLPAALPGYIAGCKQGWAFSWRSLMAAEIIAISPQLGTGLGAYLKQGSDYNSMPGVIAAIFLILIVGIGIELLAFRPVERRVLQSRGLSTAR